jgi:hypothetical protein
MGSCFGASAVVVMSTFHKMQRSESEVNQAAKNTGGFSEVR